MKVVFRVDASLQIGSGHVMRCLTLADALRTQGAQCHFLCREHPGHLIELIHQRGYSVHALPPEQVSTLLGEGSIHAAWLGATQMQDAKACIGILESLQADWLIIDHYALDIHWEETLKPYYRYLMVIDDLADRSHDCELLLDQNLGRQVSDYVELVPPRCTVLAGPQYALLRPEFAALREYSLKRREEPRLQNILITMGGVDQPNATSRVLEVLKQCSVPADCRISVVMGAKAPWIKEVRLMAVEMPWPTKVLVNVGDMAQRMANCDLAIGAAGSTSWERCCLGVPTLMLVLAENQWPGACALRHAQAVELIGAAASIGQLPSHFPEFVVGAALKRMGQMAASVTDGLGANRVADSLKRLFRE